jgi:hypothetical protein
MSSFKVVYERETLAILTFTVGDARSPTVHTQLFDRDEFLMEICESVEQAQ